MKILGYVAMTILMYWATTRLLFGWYPLFTGNHFGWYPYYMTGMLSLFECAFALFILWEIGLYLTKGQFCTRGC